MNTRGRYINQRDCAYPGCRECAVQFMAFRVACEDHTPPCFRFERRQNVHSQLERALRELPKVRVA